jgi:hypothetical protein
MRVNLRAFPFNEGLLLLHPPDHKRVPILYRPLQFLSLFNPGEADGLLELGHSGGFATVFGSMDMGRCWR